MATNLGEVPERGFLPITLVFYDGGESGPQVNPTSATWRLTDGDGAVINGRSEEALELSSGVGLIKLKDDDLALSGANKAVRLVTVRGRYNSVQFGDDVPIVAELRLTVVPLAGVPAGG